MHTKIILILILIHTKIYSLLALWFQRRRIFSCFSYHKPIVDSDAPAAWPILTPGAWLAGFITLLHTKYKTSGPHGFREELL